MSTCGDGPQRVLPGFCLIHVLGNEISHSVAPSADSLLEDVVRLAGFLSRVIHRSMTKDEYIPKHVVRSMCRAGITRTKCR